jgi:hypothetical protein
MLTQPKFTIDKERVSLAFPLFNRDFLGKESLVSSTCDSFAFELSIAMFSVFGIGMFMSIYMRYCRHGKNYKVMPDAPTPDS